MIKVYGITWNLNQLLLGKVEDWQNGGYLKKKKKIDNTDICWDFKSAIFMSDNNFNKIVILEVLEKLISQVRGQTHSSRRYV